MVARCLFWLLVGCLLIIMFSFSRKRFDQVILIGALSIASGVVLRLLSMHSAEQDELTHEAYFLVAIGILYGLVWLGARYLSPSSNRARATRASKADLPPARDEKKRSR